MPARVVASAGAINETIDIRQEKKQTKKKTTQIGKQSLCVSLRHLKKEEETG